MDKAEIFAALEADDDVFQEFIAFHARQAAQRNQRRSDVPETAQVSEPDRRARSPTFGRSSDPVRPRDDDQRGRSVQWYAPASSHDPGHVSNGTSRSNLASPPRRPKTVTVHARGQSSVPALPHSTPPPLPRSDSYQSSSRIPRDPSPRRRDYSAPRNPPATSHHGNLAAPRGSSLAPRRNYTPTQRDSSPTSHRGRSPAPRHDRSPLPRRDRSPAPRRRSPAPHWSSPAPRHSSPAPRWSSPAPRRSSPAPRRSSPARHHSRTPRQQERSPSAPRGSTPPPRRRDETPRASNEPAGSDNEPDDPDAVEYDTCPTSYETRTGAGGKRVRGGRKKDAQGKVQYTHLEKLIKRKRKHEYIKRHPHPFGRKHDMYFNPYSGRRADIKCYKQVPRPVGVQIGRGGFLLHEAIGTRSDYEFTKGILLYFRKGLTKFRPAVTLAKGKTLTWSHYGSSRRKQLHDYMYDRYPFLQHFSDESGEDCWVITMMAQRYLGGSGSYRRKEGKMEGRGKDMEEEEEEEVAEEDKELGGPEASAINPNDYEDDYTANSAHTS